MISAAQGCAFLRHERHWASRVPTSSLQFQPTLLPSTSERRAKSLFPRSRRMRAASGSTSIGSWIFGESFVAPRKQHAQTLQQPSGEDERSLQNWWRTQLLLTL